MAQQTGRTMSMTAKETILDAVRSALKRGPLDPTSRQSLDVHRPSHTRPAIDEDPVERFVRKFESRAGTVSRVARLEDVPAEVEAHRARFDLPRRAAVGGALQALTWPQDWTVHHGAAGIDETLSVTACLCGIAESGSLLLAGGPDNPTTHNFVPDDHVVVLHADRIVTHFEDAWVLLREREGGMPRATNIVSGPSRTADVEQTIQLGAHGPRRVHVVIIG